MRIFVGRFFLNAECAKRPVLILLEDLHWGDRPTIQFLDVALRELQDKPIFVLALGRPEVRETFPELWAHRKLVEIHLKELGRRAIERLVLHALGEHVPRETIERFVRLSEGNAFYLDELIRFSAERRAGGELLTKRRQSRVLNEDEFAFRHALLREGAYGMLTEEDRVLGHKLAALWLESSGEEDALLLADHFENGGDAERAAHHYERAATRAYLSGDSAAAVAHAKRGLACVSAPESRVELLGALCLAHFWQLEHLGAALPYADEVLRRCCVARSRRKGPSFVNDSREWGVCRSLSCVTSTASDALDPRNTSSAAMIAFLSEWFYGVMTSVLGLVHLQSWLRLLTHTQS